MRLNKLQFLVAATSQAVQFYQVCIEILLGIILTPSVAVAASCKHFFTIAEAAKCISRKVVISACKRFMVCASCCTPYIHLPLLTFPHRWISFCAGAFMTLMFPMTTEIFGYDVFIDAKMAAQFCRQQWGTNGHNNVSS